MQAESCGVNFDDEDDDDDNVSSQVLSVMRKGKKKNP